MIKVKGKILFFIVLLIALATNVITTATYPVDAFIETEFSLEEKHGVAGDLELNDCSRTSTVNNSNAKNFLSFLPSDFVTDGYNYNLLVKTAKGAVLLKKHLLLIYVYHNFW